MKLTRDQQRAEHKRLNREEVAARATLKRIKEERAALGKMPPGRDRGKRSEEAMHVASRKAANDAGLDIQIYLLRHPLKDKAPPAIRRAAIERACNRHPLANILTVERHITRKEPFIRIRLTESLRRFLAK